VNKHSVSSHNGSRERRRFSPAQIEQFLDDFESADVSAAEFVREQGLCYSTFCLWRRHRQRRASRPSAPRLQPLSIGSLLGPSWAAAVSWVNALIEAARRTC
jgi:hypothetical protein